MKSDRELLELAANAAGIPPPVDSNGVWSAWSGTMDNGHWWDPLADDGDALRLAVGLGIEFHIEGGKDDEAVWANEVMIWTEGERFAATRRAIVRAAAAIGEAMQ